MTFIVVLIALLVERFFDWGHLRYMGWIRKGMSSVASGLKSQSPYVAMSVFILPILVIVIVLELFLGGMFFGFLQIIFQLFVVLFCLGPRNLWAESFACIHALSQGDVQFAADKLKSAFGITEIGDEQKVQNELVGRVMEEANSRVFAVVFWFTALGAFGALLYRILSEITIASKSDENLMRFHESAKTTLEVLDWLPIRVLTFLFALGGQCVQVLNAWRKSVLLGLVGNKMLLEDCGRAALGSDGDKEKVPAKAAISLLDRVFIIALVLIAFVDVLV